MRGMDYVIGVRRVRLPFVKFVGVDGGAVSRRGSDGGMRAYWPVFGGEPVEAHGEHGDEREAQPDQHKGRGMRDHGNS
ncbi:hypothetical protein WI29_08415 [Burkholderia ubonensis]|nr:hypothetical protein WI31_11195 [Burkholderia ubonensis]KUZ25680.1 hypothetical protein WI29_08415 [Burkholderia ubonensis]